jgi:hypothetical protein
MPASGPRAGGPPASGPPASAHDIRRFESAVWSLFVLSDNTSLPAPYRAACRLAAEFAAARLAPGAPEVATLVELAVEVGGGEGAVPDELLLARLRTLGWQGPPTAILEAPAPLQGAPPRNLVSERLRAQALETVLRQVEARLSDKALVLLRREEFARRVEELRRGPGDIRTKTERAFELLEVVERNAGAAARRKGPTD